MAIIIVVSHNQRRKLRRRRRRVSWCMPSLSLALAPIALTTQTH